MEPGWDKKEKKDKGVSDAKTSRKPEKGRLMRKAVKVRGRQGIWKGVLALALVMLIGLFADGLAIVSHAQSQGRVTASSVNIRKEPDRNSEVVGSAVQGKEVTINNQVQGKDNYTWYQVFVNADTLGYIRSDLVEIIDGTTPPTVTPVEPTTPSGTASGDVERLNPVSATVKGGNSVRIRSSASAATSDNIVTTVSNGLVLTVTGRTAADSSGKVWYKVNFSDNGSEVEGFIREDYVTISGELTPYVEEPIPELPPEEQDPEPVEPEPEVTKDYETALIEGEWWLLDYTKDQRHKILDLLSTAETNSKAYADEHKKAESEKVVIIILIFLLVAAASGIAMLVFKIKDMSDDAYFNQVERETLRRRGEIRAQSGSQKVMHTVGTDKSASGRPAGARPSGAPQGQKPSGARPSGAPQGQKPAGVRPSGAPQGQKTAGERPAGSGQGASQGQRTAGERPAGSGQGQKPSEASRESGSAENRQGQGASAQKPAQGQQGWQSKNFMSGEDDEFEFGFLNYDGTEEK